MQISKSRLKQIIAEEYERVQEEMHPGNIDRVDHGEPPPDMLGDPDYEGEMARGEMLRAAKYATQLVQMIGDTDQLPAWVQSKITKAADYISVAKEYLENRSELNAMDQEGSEEIEVVDEIMTSRDKAKRDKLAKELEPKMSRYGKRAKEVAFAIATKQVQGVGGGNKRRDED
jgi:hypothetical protein